MRIPAAVTVALLAAVAAVAANAASSSPTERAAWQQYGPNTVLVCHKTASQTKPFVTLSISREVLSTYLRRGATVGPCVYGAVRTGGSVSLRTWKGQPIRALDARRLYSIVVTDASRVENFHLRGKGIDRSTGLKARGTVRWKVRLTPGRYSYRSDAHPRLQRFFTARAQGSA